MGAVKVDDVEGACGASGGGGAVVVVDASFEGGVDECALDDRVDALWR